MARHENKTTLLHIQTVRYRMQDFLVSECGVLENIRFMCFSKEEKSKCVKLFIYLIGPTEVFALNDDIIIAFLLFYLISALKYSDN